MFRTRKDIEKDAKTIETQDVRLDSIDEQQCLLLEVMLDIRDLLTKLEVNATQKWGSKL